MLAPAPAALGDRLADARADETLRFEPIDRDVDGAHRQVAARAMLDLPSNRRAVRIGAQTKERDEDELLEIAERQDGRVGCGHMLHTVDDIQTKTGGQGLADRREYRGTSGDRLAPEGVSVRILEGLVRDFRHALRALAAAPAFTAVVVGVLTLGLGASIAIFSVVDATLLRGLPFDRADRLVAVGDLAKAANGDYETPQDFLDWRDRQDVFAHLAAMAYGGISLKREGAAAPETLVSVQVTSGFFEVLHVSPIMGRTFAAADERSDSRVGAVISYGLWQRRFGGRPDVVGATLPGQLRTFEVIGVMPRGFEYPVRRDRPDRSVWVPIVFSAEDASARVLGTGVSFRSSVACATGSRSRWRAPTSLASPPALRP